MHIEEAYGHVIRNFPGEAGRFYSPGTALALGKGCIYGSTIFALFDEAHGVYRTAQGVAYLLTHECDIDEGNDRPFNEYLLVCPIVPLEDVVAELSVELDSGKLKSFLANLGSRNVSRLIYLPPVVDHFPYGAVMFLNQVTNAPVSVVKARSQLICALTGFGLQAVEFALENHLLRPKADRLALVPEGQA